MFVQSSCQFRLALVAVGLLSLASPAVAQKKYALLVGINEYANHPKLKALAYAENDAMALKAALEKDKAKNKDGFDEVVVMTQTLAKQDKTLAPTADNIRKQLRTLESKLKSADLLLVALSGHGVTITLNDGKDENFLCTEDTVPARQGANDLATLEKSMVALGRLLRGWEDVVGVKLLLVDACRTNVALEGAKSFSSDYQPRLAKGIGVLFSCNVGEMSWEEKSLKTQNRFGHGIFTYYLLEALAKAKNVDGEVTWNTIIDYVPKRVARGVIKYKGDGAQQTPHQVNNLVGTVPFLLKPEGQVTNDDVFRQGLMSYTGKGAAVDMVKSYKLFTKAGNDGHIVARATQAWMLHHGQGIDADSGEATAMFRKVLPDLENLAENDADAQLRLGACYALGVGVEKDVNKGAKLYELSVAQKNSMAMNNLANLLMNGSPKDKVRGIELYREAAKFGEVAALLNLGGRYTIGSGVEKDLRVAFGWYEKAAKVGSATGLFELGKRYEQGEGVAKDENKAVALFEDAIERNHPGAMNNLARMYEDGRGVRKSEAKAFEKYQQAAKLGYLPAMYNVGICYRNGIGTPQSRDGAISWFRKVAATPTRGQFEETLRKNARKQLAELGDDI